MIKILCILIFESFFLSLASLEKTKHGISSHISISLTIIDSEMVLKEFLYQVNLTKTQPFCIHKLAEVIIVGKNKNLVFEVL